MPQLSVITASFNAAADLPALAASLSAQTFRDFEWLVMDGASTDGTVAFLKAFSAINPWCRFISERDFGIYDAMNRGIRLSQSLFYVAAGADDTFREDALGRYHAAISAYGALADVILAKVEIAGVICGGYRPGRSWLGHQQVFRGSHSVGMMLRKSLHDRCGYYSNRFPMLADGYFLKMVMAGGAGFVEQDFVAGRFALGGLSSSGKLQSLAEGWQIQMLTENSKLLQVALFIIKLVLRLPALLLSTR